MSLFTNPNLLGKSLRPHFGVASDSWSWNIVAYTAQGVCSQISQSLPVPFDYLWPTALICILLDTYQHLRLLPASSIVQPLANIWSCSYQKTGLKLFYCTGTAFQRAHELVCSPDTNSLIKSSLIKSIALGSEREAGGSKLIAILLLVLLLTSTNNNALLNSKCQ